MKVKTNMIELCGKEIYDGLMRMMTDDSFTEPEAVELMNRILNITKNSNKDI